MSQIKIFVLPLLFTQLLFSAAQEADPRLIRTIEMPNTLTSITSYGQNFIVAADEEGAVWRLSSIEHERISQMLAFSSVINIGKYPNDRLIRLIGDCLEELEFNPEKKVWQENDLSADWGDYEYFAATANPNKLVAVAPENVRIFDIQQRTMGKEKFTRVDELREQGLLSPLPENLHVKLMPSGTLRMALDKPDESPGLHVDFDDSLTIRALQSTCRLPNGLWVVGRGKTIKIFDISKEMPTLVRQRLLSKPPDLSRMINQQLIASRLREDRSQLMHNHKLIEEMRPEGTLSHPGQKKPKIAGDL